MRNAALLMVVGLMGVAVAAGCDSGGSSDPIEQPAAYACADGTTAEAVACDGVATCADGSDELGCEAPVGFSAARVLEGPVFAGYPVTLAVDGVDLAGVEVTLNGKILAPISRVGAQVTVLTPGDAAGAVELAVRSAAAPGTARVAVEVTGRPSLEELLVGTSYSDAPTLLAGRVAEVPVLLSGFTSSQSSLSRVAPATTMLSGFSPLQGVVEGSAALLVGTPAESEAALELLTVEAVLLAGSTPGRLSARARPASETDAAIAAALIEYQERLSAQAATFSAIFTTIADADTQNVAIGSAVAVWLGDLGAYFVQLDEYVEACATRSLQALPDGGGEPFLRIGTPLSFQLNDVFTIDEPEVIASMGDLLTTIEFAFNQLTPFSDGGVQILVEALEETELSYAVSNADATDVSAVVSAATPADHAAVLVGPMNATAQGSGLFGFTRETGGSLTDAGTATITISHGEQSVDVVVRAVPADCDDVCAGCGPDAYFDGSVCAPAATCAANEFAAVPLAYNRDRICSPHTPCSASEFESAPPTATTDRDCSPHTLCSGAEFESAPPTATTDRVCSPLTPECLPGEKETTAPDATTDRVCTLCRRGEYCAGAAVPAAYCGYLDRDDDPTTPCVELAAGGMDASGEQTCTVDTLGNVECWGKNARPLPSDTYLGGVVEVVVGRNLACARDTAKHVQCWGDDTDTIEALSTRYPDLENTEFAQVVTGDFHICVIEEGTNVVACVAGNNINNQADATVSTAVELSAGARGTCAILLDGSVECWGNVGIQGTPSITETPPGISATEISVGGAHACALVTDGAIACWGSGDAVNNAPVTNNNAAISANGNYSCAIDAGGTTDCWGSLGTPPAPPAELGPFRSLSESGVYACGITVGGQPRCWTMQTVNELDPIPHGYGFVSDFVVLGDELCLLDEDGVQCVGRGVGSTNEEAPGYDETSDTAGLIAGATGVCAQSAAGDFTCWGNDTNDQLSGFDSASDAPVAALGAGIGCATDTNGVASCWGNTGSNPGITNGTTAVIDIAIGTSFACAVRDPGGVREVACNGLAAPTPVGEPDRVFAGYTHACVTVGTDTVYCSGTLEGSAAPSSLTFGDTVEALALGVNHTCALLGDGTVECQGRSTEGQLDVPIALSDGTETVAQLRAAYQMTCASTVLGALHCWGTSNFGLVSIPD